MSTGLHEVMTKSGSSFMFHEAGVILRYRLLMVGTSLSEGYGSGVSCDSVVQGKLDMR